MGETARDISELQTLWRSRGIVVASLAPGTDGTIRPPSLTLPPDDFTPPPAAQLLDDGGEHIAIHETLGQGGMGVVKRAVQLSLGREVAVKVVRDADDGARVAAQLVREARITGALEHPNVVPVHALYRDQRGWPAIVLKRIAGVPWGELIRDRRHPALVADGRVDPLELHLDVFLQVCSAVHFAHSKGIVHRDLKPDNVMIGAFGEVYVVDWGLAVSTRPGELGAVAPLASEVCGVAGTPQYMAPEQAAADGARLDERTDVYLLGATLHECVTGTPRHVGETVGEQLLSAYRSEPVGYGSEVPAELAAIGNRATHVDPAQRFSSVAELRAAIVTYRRRRSAAAIGRAALARLEALRAMLGEGPASSVHEIHLQGLFSECRFGLQQSLVADPENIEARAGLRTALLLMADFQVARGDHRAAAVLAAELAPVPPELAARLKALRGRLAEDERRRAALQQLARDTDLGIGTRTRARVALILAATSGLAPLGLGVGVRAGWYPFGYGVLAAINIAFSLISLVIHWRLGKVLTSTRVSRRIVHSMWVLATALWGSTLVGYALGVSVAGTVPIMHFTCGVTFAMIGVAIDLRLVWCTLIYAAATALSLRFPGAALEISGLANIAIGGVVAFVWRARPPATH